MSAVFLAAALLASTATTPASATEATTVPPNKVTLLDGYDAFPDTWQDTTNLHSVVDLETNSYYHECAAYCSIRGDVFTEGKCEGFYVDLTDSTCHMIPSSLMSDLSDSGSGITLYKKMEIEIVEPPASAPAPADP